MAEWRVTLTTSRIKERHGDRLERLKRGTVIRLTGPHRVVLPEV